MKKYLILLISIITIVLTVYFSILPLNWLTQLQVSKILPTYITPAWYTFSIWSLIYISWIFLWFYLIRTKSKEIWKKYILYLASAILLSAIWLIPYHNLLICFTLSIIILILWLLYYIMIYPTKDIVFQKITEIYFWWIFVATILNLHIILVFNWKYEYWLYIWIISLIIWAIVSIYLLRKYNLYIANIIYIWAMFWIIVWQSSNYIIISALISIYIVTVDLALRYLRWQIKK